MNRAMLKVHTNSQDEDFKRKINQKILQNRKLDALYGRKSKSPRREIEQAIIDLEKDDK